MDAGQGGDTAGHGVPGSDEAGNAPGGDGPAADAGPRRRGFGRLLATYTAGRALFFLAAAVLLNVLTRPFVAGGVNGFPLLLVALLVSSIASLLLLRGQRAALTQAAAERTEARLAAREDRSERLREG